MRNRITDYDDEHHEPEQDVRPIADILEELLAEYATRYPTLKITVVESPPATV